jgi:hypothetical protein
MVTCGFVEPGCLPAGYLPAGTTLIGVDVGVIVAFGHLLLYLLFAFLIARAMKGCAKVSWSFISIPVINFLLYLTKLVL